MSLYELHVRSSDALGLGMIEALVDLAASGATLKAGVLPRLTFPHCIQMVIETDEEPTPTPNIRVFNMTEGSREITIKRVEPESSGFSMNAPVTKESLDAMDFADFRNLCKTVGVKGRDRNQMTREYMKAKESQE